jgi:RND superfamily putative drug exporter
MDVEESAARAIGTAGSAVVFAGSTVIIALVGLSVVNLPFLTIMGCMSALTVAFGVCLALTLLPAMMGLFGERLRPKQAKAAKQAKAESRWNPAKWWATVVTKVPLLWCALVLVALGALSLPAANLEMSLPNSGQSEIGARDRTTFDLIKEHFGVGYNGALVVTFDIVELDDPMAPIDGIKADIEAMPGVKLVSTATPNANVDTAMLQVIPQTAPDDPATSELVHQINDRKAEWQERYDVTIATTGYTAMSIDVSNRLADSMLPFALFVVGLSFLLLMMVFRSIWVPLKAALGYLLSVGGAFGATQLVFNEGWFGWLVNLSETRPVISFLPIFGMGILFGLAMDYEVFLTSRMREEHVHGNPNSVVDGFVHSSKVVVAAAVIMLGVFAFFVPASEGMVKPIAFCLAVGVALDAFLIRMTLGPAIMKLLGEHAWWLPKWLDRLLPTLDVEGESLANQVKIRATFDAHPHPVEARGLSAEIDGKTLFSDFDLEVGEGQVAVVAAAPEVRRALFYALSGRVKLTAGEALIAGHVMGYESGAIRGKTLLLTSTDDFNQAFPSKAKVVLVDNADQLSSSQRQMLRDAMRESLAGWIFGADPEWDPTAITNSYTTTSQLSGAGVGGNDD